MGIVSQQPILFNTSFRQNIAFGVETPDMDKVENAARIANAHEFIMETEQVMRALLVNQEINSVEGSGKE